MCLQAPWLPQWRCVMCAWYTLLVLVPVKEGGATTSVRAGHVSGLLLDIIVPVVGFGLVAGSSCGPALCGVLRRG